MNLKIISKGTGAETQVIDTETGEKLGNARVVDWHVEAGGLATARIELVKVEVELEVLKEQVKFDTITLKTIKNLKSEQNKE
ncbi:MAG: hypothetical protein KGO96_07705 [Elusimicrobia bacterium]|nr:hypothetical protein [Elusimicrobiota bacterium]